MTTVYWPNQGGYWQAPSEDVAALGWPPGSTRKPKSGPSPGVDPGMVLLRSNSEGIRVKLMGPPRILDGYGGWEQVDRHHKLPIVEWMASTPYRMQLDLLFDGWKAQASVETGIHILERMARDPGGDKEPPVVNAFGALPRSQTVDWVVEALEWADDEQQVIWHWGGYRLRQGVSVTLLQKTTDDLVSRVKQQAKRKGKAKSYTAKRGDTLAKIAAKLRINVRALKAKNPSIRDPGKQITVGRKVKLP